MAFMIRRLVSRFLGFTVVQRANVHFATCTSACSYGEIVRRSEGALKKEHSCWPTRPDEHAESGRCSLFAHDGYYHDLLPLLLSL